MGLALGFMPREEGYSKNPNTMAHMRDIMEVGTGRDPGVTGGWDTYQISLAGPGVGMGMQPEQDFSKSLIEGNTRTESFMEMLNPEKSAAGAYRADSIDTKSLMRDVNKPITDGAQVSRKANEGLADVKEKMGNFMQDWNQAKTEALDMLQETAVAQGIDPMVAVDSIIPDDSPTKATAMAYIAGEAAFGAGTLATMGKASFIADQIGDEKKKLKPDEIKALLEETLQRLQATRPIDSRAQAGVSTAAPEPANPSEIAWENMEMEDLCEFMAADPTEEPEFAELAQLEYELEEEVLPNHDYVREYYGVRGDLVAKAMVEVEAGNEAIKNTLEEATIVQSDAPVYYDAGHTSLVGDSVSDFGKLVTNTTMDTTNVAKVLDHERLNVPELQRQLTAAINLHFDAGMR